MSTVTYKNQPAIHSTRGSVPLAGTSHVYKVKKLLWTKEIEEYLSTLLIGRTLHICCGLSKLGDIRLDLYADNVDLIADAARIPFKNKSFDTVLCDPPYNSKFQWMHDMLNELHRLAKQRIIFQHWFSPIDKQGRFKKANIFQLSEMCVEPVIDRESEEFSLSDLSAWMPRTYFGRMQIISVLDKVEV